jgi:hypothetical protein
MPPRLRLLFSLALDQSRDRVEIYARGKPLSALLSARQLSITDAAGSNVLGAHEIGLRFNNRDRMRAARIPLVMAYAAAAGVGALLLILVASGRLAYKDEKQ